MKKEVETQIRHRRATLKEAIKIHIDYLMAAAETLSRWEELTRIDGDEE